MPLSAPSAHASTARQLKWLVVVLAASNLLLGLFSVYVLRQADRRYSELLRQSVPVLNDLQTLTDGAARSMVSTNPDRVLATDGGPAGKSVEADRAFREQILGEPWLPSNGTDRQQIQIRGDAFTAAARHVLALVSAGRVADATHERETALLPAFSRYLEAITKAADVLEAESDRRNAAESERTSKVSTVVLGVAGWPVLIVLLLLILTAVFVLVLMVLFRGREMSDMP